MTLRPVALACCGAVLRLIRPTSQSKSRAYSALASPSRESSDCTLVSWIVYHSSRAQICRGACTQPGTC